MHVCLPCLSVVFRLKQSLKSLWRALVVYLLWWYSVWGLTRSRPSSWEHSSATNAEQSRQSSTGLAIPPNLASASPRPSLSAASRKPSPRPSRASRTTTPPSTSTIPAPCSPPLGPPPASKFVVSTNHFSAPPPPSLAPESLLSFRQTNM